MCHLYWDLSLISFLRLIRGDEKIRTGYRRYYLFFATHSKGIMTKVGVPNFQEKYRVQPTNKVQSAVNRSLGTGLLPPNTHATLDFSVLNWGTSLDGVFDLGGKEKNNVELHRRVRVGVYVSGLVNGLNRINYLNVLA
ncbi:hypothetical protein DGG96_08340 [Legionella qingyii]|uniref:Uncharacterized protein n=1 Tax=Legionella qingyii TaxID=2184757 RepID=A0A317U6J4_9GAMM|nr:hypothetical protein DGG96_08340 [Legionella qingyii]